MVHATAETDNPQCDHLLVELEAAIAKKHGAQDIWEILMREDGAAALDCDLTFRAHEQIAWFRDALDRIAQGSDAGHMAALAREALAGTEHQRMQVANVIIARTEA
jgi:hypothetical protein